MYILINILLFALYSYYLITTNYARYIKTCILTEIFENEFKIFQIKYRKIYGKNITEIQLRRQIFLESRLDIAAHNWKYSNGHVMYSLIINHISDLTFDEVESKYNATPTDLNQSNVLKILNSGQNLTATSKRSVTTVPDNKNWVEEGAVTPVQDQGDCRCCYAFAALGALESQYFIKHNIVEPLSVQHIIDCSSGYPYFNQKCKGGQVHSTYDFIKINHGVDTANSYPYHGYANTICPSRSNEDLIAYMKRRVSLKTYEKIKENDEEELKKYVGLHGPVAVGIDGLDKHFQHYNEGIYHRSSCAFNHAVLVVGYETDAELNDYWIIKNSFNPEIWGDKGYMKMKRNMDKTCNIAKYAFIPVI